MPVNDNQSFSSIILHDQNSQYFIHCVNRQESNFSNHYGASQKFTIFHPLCPTKLKFFIHYDLSTKIHKYFIHYMSLMTNPIFPYVKPRDKNPIFFIHYNLLIKIYKYFIHYVSNENLQILHPLWISDEKSILFTSIKLFQQKLIKISSQMNHMEKSKKIMSNRLLSKNPSKFQVLEKTLTKKVNKDKMET